MTDRDALLAFHAWLREAADYASEAGTCHREDGDALAGEWCDGKALAYRVAAEELKKRFLEKGGGR